MADEMRALEQAIIQYKNTTNVLPRTLEELLDRGPDGLPYLKGRNTIPRDAYGLEFAYRPHADGKTFE
jgi:hypothetical protein